MTTLFISGIDTDVGKSVACAALANTLLTKHYHLFTQKWVETGVRNGVSADITTHQQLAAKPFNTAQSDQHTPYLFTFPASPHLAAELEQSVIDPEFLKKQTRALESQCDHVLIEGAGGLYVPLNRQVFIIDMVATMNLPVVLVTCGKLGSINHTLLSVEACKQRNIEIRAIIYNHYPVEPSVIVEDTRQLLKQQLEAQLPETLWLELCVNVNDLALSEQQICQLLA